MPEMEPKEDQPTPHIEFSGVRLSRSAIETIRRNRVTFTLPRAEIGHLELHHGFKAERPLIQALLALAMLAFCFFPIRTIIAWMIHGGTLSDVVLLLLLLLPLGTWMLADALRRGPFIRVHLASQKAYKLAFRGRPSAEELRRFASEANHRYGCIIHGL